MGRESCAPWGSELGLQAFDPCPTGHPARREQKEISGLRGLPRFPIFLACPGHKQPLDRLGRAPARKAKPRSFTNRMGA